MRSLSRGIRQAVFISLWATERVRRGSDRLAGGDAVLVSLLAKVLTGSTGPSSEQV